MRIAFVYDRVNKFGGAERVLLALHEVWPQAPLFTTVYNQKTAPWASTFNVKPSLRLPPFFSARHEIFLPITPFIFESLNLDNFDVVLSITSAEAKGIITKPHTLHICYCLTPTRYLWSGYQDYLDEPGVGILNHIARIFMKAFFPPLRLWDFTASSYPDFYIAISQTVKRRIKAYYKKEAEIIYPPIDTEKFKPTDGCSQEDYFLVVSRLVPYKRIDYVISTFNSLGWKLKIVGRGVDEGRLRKMAKKNVEFLGGNLTDEKLCWYYQNCQALIFPGEEDFGITSVEAQACGRPVIGINCGGVVETIIPGKTGEIYNRQDEKTLISALKIFKQKKYLPFSCRQNAIRFTKKTFKEKIKKTVANLWEEWRDKIKK